MLNVAVDIFFSHKVYRTGCPKLAVELRVSAGHTFLAHVDAMLCAHVGGLTVRMFVTVSHCLIFLSAHSIQTGNILK